VRLAARALVGPVRAAVDQEAAGAADPFAAIAVERDRALARGAQLLVEAIERVQQRLPGVEPVERMVLEPPLRARVRLTPDLQLKPHA